MLTVFEVQRLDTSNNWRSVDRPIVWPPFIAKFDTLKEAQVFQREFLLGLSPERTAPTRIVKRTEEVVVCSQCQGSGTVQGDFAFGAQEQDCLECSC